MSADVLNAAGHITLWFEPLRLLTKVNYQANNTGMGLGIFPSKALKIALRVLQAYSDHTPPAAADEAYLRKLASDTTTPGDELACQIIQTELQKLRSKNTASVAAGEAISNEHSGHAAGCLPQGN